MRSLSLLLLMSFASSLAYSQLSWSKEGNSYVAMENGALVQTTMPSLTKEVLVKAEALTIPGNTGTGRFQRTLLSDDQQKILLYANTRRSYHNTFGSAVFRTSWCITAFMKNGSWGYCLATGLIISKGLLLLTPKIFVAICSYCMAPAIIMCTMQGKKCYSMN